MDTGELSPKESSVHHESCIDSSDAQNLGISTSSTSSCPKDDHHQISTTTTFSTNSSTITTTNNKPHRKHRARRRLGSKNEPMTTTGIPEWKRFQDDQTHSLRISVSDVAACAGFHPYKDLINLFLMDHVYQGFGGSALLHHDADLLGLSLQSDEDQWNELAALAGKETQKALKAALHARKDSSKVTTIERAETIQKKVLTEAQKSKKLSNEQLQILQDAARYSVYTGFGTKWESDALDLYQKQCGWDVGERNIQRLIWPFERDGQDTVKPMQDPYAIDLTISREETNHLHQQQGDQQEGQNLSSQKIRPSKRAKVIPEIVIDLVDDNDADDNNNNCTDENYETSCLNSENRRESLDQNPFFSLRGCVDGIRDELVPTNKDMNSDFSRKEEKMNNDNDDEDSWFLTRVIVECKHRMRRIQPTPPLYELIQATAYCLMYKVSDADLVQVLRQKRILKQGKENQVKKSAENTKKTSDRNSICEGSGNGNDKTKKHPLFSDKEVAQEKSVLIDEATQTRPGAKGKDTSCDDITSEKCGNDVDVRNNNNNSSTTKTLDNPDDIAQPGLKNSPQIENKIPGDTPHPEHSEYICEPCNTNESVGKEDEDEDEVSMEISIHRVRIDDPIFRHRWNWESVILPRLRSWVEAVYRVRRCDETRYKLLIALASSSQSSPAATISTPGPWEILFSECPWLAHCDTLYHRNGGTANVAANVNL